MAKALIGCLNIGGKFPELQELDTRLEIEDDSLTFSELGDQNGGMSAQGNTKPFQYQLRSIFLATAAISVVLGLLHWLRPDDLPLQVIVAVIAILVTQFAAVMAILVTSKGTAWPSVVAFGLFAAAYIQILTRFSYTYWPVILFWSSLSAWFGGGSGADVELKRQSRFLRWAWLLALIWFLIVVAIEPPIIFVDWRTVHS